MKKILILIIITCHLISCDEFVGSTLSISIDNSSFDYTDIIISEKIKDGFIRSDIIRVDNIKYNTWYTIENSDYYYTIQTVYNANNGFYNNKIEKVKINSPTEFRFYINVNNIETNAELKHRDGKTYLLEYKNSFEDSKHNWYNTLVKQYEAYQKAIKEFNSSKYN